MPILANIVGPPRSTASNKASIAARYSVVSCSFFGSIVRPAAASIRVVYCG